MNIKLDYISIYDNFVALLAISFTSCILFRHQRTIIRALTYRTTI